MNKKERAKTWYAVLWIVLAFIILSDAGIMAITVDGVPSVSNQQWFEQLINSAKLRTNFYLAMGTVAIVLYWKQDEVMQWLEVHAPF